MKKWNKYTVLKEDVEEDHRQIIIPTSAGSVVFSGITVRNKSNILMTTEYLVNTKNYII